MNVTSLFSICNMKKLCDSRKFLISVKFGKNHAKLLQLDLVKKEMLLIVITFVTFRSIVNRNLTLPNFCLTQLCS